ncbi:hypothetical protein EJ02DRAFT_367583 [Clathrospora elynae]|uniref:Uncharacterized protein n=1 Tax=Clathrospora elynae TaxID=706981 RepID=A0A6A5T106_9PLEO|nr:hypothetical protein EJ02DRAFT_367583 [Clathrospora elynae]
MSENNKTAAANGASLQFTGRELQLLGWAMQSLKSGPLEIDYEKLAGYANMSNPRSAGNAWAKLRFKLMTPAPDSAIPVTPKKAGGRKMAAATTEDSEGSPSTLKKVTPRKRAARKQDVDGETSPKKKPARGKKASDDEDLKAESDGTEDLKPSPMEFVPAEGKIEDTF